ncbi:MAG: PAS domain S-box protein [Planctomycetes bacterium]|nr:PAS domain S-box protein [Planctomycetota bacterium]
MDPSFPITVLTLLLLIQGVGSLFLAIILGALYGYRRQANLLYWTLAWLCNALWLLLGSLNFRLVAEGAPVPRLGGEPVLQHVAVVCGWLHAALWLLSMQHFRGQTEGAPPEQPVTDHAPSAPKPRPLSALFPPTHLAVLLVTALAALGISRSMPLTQRNAWLGLLLAGVYLWSALVLVRFARKVRRVVANFLAVALALYAADRLHYGWVYWTEPAEVYASYAALADFLMQVLTAVALLLFLLDTEHGELSDAVQRLEESEERFRLIFEHSGVGMTLLTRDGRFLQVNPALVRMLGYTAEELRGRRLVDLVHQGDVTLESAAGQPPAGETPSLYEREKRYLRKDGQSIWARVVRVPIRDASGKARHYVGVLVDITERKRMEEELAASEQRYRLLNQTAHEGIYVTGERGEFLDANPAFCRMLGLPRDEVLTLTLEQVAEDSAAVRQHQARVGQHGGDRLETRLRRSSVSGEPVDVELSGARLDLEGRRFLHGICRDVSERKRAEEALREAQERLREERDFSKQILETANVLLCVVDREGRIVRFNGTCAALAGCSEDEVRGKIFWDLFSGRDAAVAREEHLRLVASGVRGQESGVSKEAGGPSSLTPDPCPLTPGLFETYWPSRSGEERLIAWRNSAVRDAQGQARYVISTGIDVTQQRQIEEQLRHARKMEMLGTLVGGIAHDFNNQLTAVLGHISLVQSDLDERAERGVGLEIGPLREPLAHAELAAQHCADITQRLLTFSSGKVGATCTLSVDSLLAETEKTLQRELPSSIHLHVQRSADTWPVAGDITQLQQVLLNLVANAHDAMPDGGTLTLAAANQELSEEDRASNVEGRSGRFVELSVSDTGVGMTPEVQARLFEPFFTTKKLGHGAGMGLAMVYGIVKAHKGWVSVQSMPGQGSTFRLYLPAAVSAVRPAGAGAPRPSAIGNRPEEPPAADSRQPIAEAECVLVVDDEDLVRALAEAVLHRWGYRVLTACDGEEALAIFKQRRAEIDLVLLDYSMPKLTGLQVFQQMQQLDPQVCVIFSSGYAVDKDSDQLLAGGARAFLPKPYRADDLIRTVRHVLDQKSSAVTSNSERP